jgi:hypothetical protein
MSNSYPSGVKLVEDAYEREAMLLNYIHVADSGSVKRSRSVNNRRSEVCL